MGRISWASVSPFSSLVGLAIAMLSLLTSALLLVPDVLLTACKSLDFQVRPAGRSVIPVPSSGLLDLNYCYLDSEQLHIGRLYCTQIRSWEYFCVVLASHASALIDSIIAAC